jgi:hypothetical protein
MFLVARATDEIPADATGSWTLHISVDSDFCLWCERNGEMRCIAFGQFTDYASQKVCEERSFSAAEVAGGRLYLVLTSQNCDTSTDRRERAGCIFALRNEKNELLWHSDENTELYFTARHRDRGVPLVTGQLGFSFDIDLREPLCGARAKTQVLDGMPSELYPRPIAPLVMGERLPAQLVKAAPFCEPKNLSPEAFGARMYRAAWCEGNDGQVADGTGYIFDLLAEQVGFMELEVLAAAPCEMLVGWGEHLADGKVRSEIGGRCFAGRVVLHQGENRLLYPLRRLGLRYLQLNVYAAADTIDIRYAGVRPVDYPLPPVKACPLPDADELDLAIYESCVRTLRLCLHDHYEDCPWREQALYTMDSRNQMLCGYYAFGETAAPRASLALIARSLREDDLLELCSPARCSITIPSFSAMFVVQLAEYMEHTGDEDAAKQLLPVARRIVQGFVARMDRKTDLIPCYPLEKHWNFYEWQTGLEGSISGSIAPEDMTYDAPLCCFVSLAMEALCRLYERFGMEQERGALAAVRARLNAAVHAAFYDSEAGVYDSYMRICDGQRYHRAQLTLSLALLCGACPPDQADRARERLANDTSLHTVTLSHSIFRYDALLADRQYLPLVHNEIREKFGYMLSQGATTFWETLQGDRDFGNAGSLCHGWSAVPVYIDWKYGR